MNSKPMTVAELIEKLKEFDPEMPVKDLILACWIGIMEKW